jgi:hypothetical protein
MVESMPTYARFWRGLLLVLQCLASSLAAFICQAASPDYRLLLHSVAPFVVLAILLGAAYWLLTTSWHRWVALAFTLSAALSFVEFVARVGW